MGKGSANKANANLDVAAGMAQKAMGYGADLINQGKPAMTQALNTYSGLASGNVPGVEKFVAPQMQDLEAQYAQAEKTVDSMPAGGARDAAKRDLAISKAGAKNRLFTGGVQSGLSQLLSGGEALSGLGLSGITGGLSGTLNVGQAYNQMASSKGATAGEGAAAAGGITAALL